MSLRFPALTLQGGLIGIDVIDQIADGSAEYQRPRDFNLPERASILDEASSAWSSARSYWESFSRRLERLPANDPATSVTRDQWLIPLFSLLGYELTYQASAEEVDGASFHISHRAGKNDQGPPVHLIGFNQSLDRRPETGRPRLAAHSLMQEYLNRTEHLWGIVSNGSCIRILRDSLLLRRQALVEFDLDQIMKEDRFSDFLLLYRLLHRTRLPKGMEDSADCILEKYHNKTIEQGGRVREGLRDGVVQALKLLGTGLLNHPPNEALRDRIDQDKLRPTAYYEQLLHLIYRLLFLMVSEERNLITSNRVYSEFYSIHRLRRLASQRFAYTDHEDLWLSLQTTFLLFEDDAIGSRLGVPPLNGHLFSPSKTADLANLRLSNRVLLEAIWNLSMYREDERSPYRRINYGALDVEELGSVYESLLEDEPIYKRASGKLTFDFVIGGERKSTGSYYTPTQLVNELIKSALLPVVQERLENARAAAKEAALLGITVCDSACGSGHFLLAAARALGRELAKVRTGDDEPGPGAAREATRDVIMHCIYGVDRNPLAVDLCKVALWIEGHVSGKPLTFLDHRIRNGDSLVGVLDLKVLKEGIPDGAYQPVTGDDRAYAGDVKRLNTSERDGTLFPLDFQHELESLAGETGELSNLPENTPIQVRRKAEVFARLGGPGTQRYCDNLAANIWTTAFFCKYTDDEFGRIPSPTTDAVRTAIRSPAALHGQLTGKSARMAQDYRFFHWPLEFPEVFAKGGFDVLLSNPPWDVMELHLEEFFAGRDQSVVDAANAAAREKLISALEHKNPKLWAEYREAVHAAECTRKFLRSSGRFALTSGGRVNSYSVFAELLSSIVAPTGRAGVIVPTGIATDNTNKEFFAELIESGRLASLYDFENREAIFPGVHRSYKFALLTIRGTVPSKRESATFGFFLTNTAQLTDDRRLFQLRTKEFLTLNPNSKTCPTFRSKADAELTKRIYDRVPVFRQDSPESNPWQVTFKQGLFNMSSDSRLFKTRAQLERSGFALDGSRFLRNETAYVRLYEGKMIWQFDHRFGSFDGISERGNTSVPRPSQQQYADSSFVVLPWYWVPENEVREQLQSYNRAWFIGFRDVTNATNERTCIFSVVPLAGVGHTMPLVFLSGGLSPQNSACFLGAANSLVFDFIARQKVGGMHLTYSYLTQLALWPPDSFGELDKRFIVPRVLELVYTAEDVKPFARDLWDNASETLRKAIIKQWNDNHGATASTTDLRFPRFPFKWDDDRRPIIRAELDAYYAKLYGLTEKELRYILDPADVYGPDYPSETFRVLKDNETRQHGEYRTRRLVLEAWERLQL